MNFSKIEPTTNQPDYTCNLTDENLSSILIKPLGEIYLFADSWLNGDR